jgi:hypothetical protein
MFVISTTSGKLPVSKHFAKLRLHFRASGSQLYIEGRRTSFHVRFEIIVKGFMNDGRVVTG